MQSILAVASNDLSFKRKEKKKRKEKTHNLFTGKLCALKNNCCSYVALRMELYQLLLKKLTNHTPEALNPKISGSQRLMIHHLLLCPGLYVTMVMYL